jgi:hypothetical protein
MKNFPQQFTPVSNVIKEVKINSCLYTFMNCSAKCGLQWLPAIICGCFCATAELCEKWTYLCPMYSVGCLKLQNGMYTLMKV